MKRGKTGRIGLAGRIITLICLVLAYLNPGIDLGPHPPDVSLYLDRSASMGASPTSRDIAQIGQALATLPSGSRVRQVHFASGTPVIVEGVPRASSLNDAQTVETLDSDLAGALAHDTWPQGDRPHLRVLVSDGMLTSGRNPDINVWLPILPELSGDEAGIGQLSVDRSQLETWSIQVPITTASEEALTIDVLLNKRRIGTKTVPAGTSEMIFRDLPTGLLPQGRHLFEAVLRGGPHGVPENDRSGHIVELSGPGRAMLVTDTSPSVVGSLIQSIGWTVDITQPDTLPDQSEGFTPYQLVVLDDVPAARLPRASIDALEAAIRNNGVGLGVLGGPRSFSAGGYLGSALEQLLPVISEDAVREKPQRIVFLVDASGSMSKSALGGTRFSYAMQAVELGLDSLRDGDESALVFFDRTPAVFAPLQPAPKSYLDRAGNIARSPSGGTDLEAALTAAIALFPSDAQADHTLVLITDGADGSDVPLDRRQIETLQTQANVTLVPILIAPGDTLPSGLADDFRSLAQGQLTVVQRIEELPRLVRAKIDAQARPIQLGPQVVSQATALPGQSGTLDWHSIDAYPVTRTRKTATTHLQSQRGDPALATSSLALGRVFAIPPGLGAWTQTWLEDPALTAAIADLLIWSSGQSDAQNLSVHLSHGDSGLRVQAETVADDGEWRTSQPLQVTVQLPSGDLESPVMTQAAPGLFETRISSQQQGVYDVTVTDGSTVTRKSIWLANREARGALDPKIGTLEGMRVWSPQDDLLPPDWPVRTWPLRPLLLSLALVTFVLLVTVELWPGILSQPVRWARRARSARDPGTGKRQKG